MAQSWFINKSLCFVSAESFRSANLLMGLWKREIWPRFTISQWWLMNEIYLAGVAISSMSCTLNGVCVCGNYIQDTHGPTVVRSHVITVGFVIFIVIMFINAFPKINDQSVAGYIEGVQDLNLVFFSH